MQTPGSEPKRLLTGADARYLPTGHIVYAIGGVLNAVPFDVRRLQLAGNPVQVVQGVRRSLIATGAAHYTVSNTGSLAYVPGPASSALVDVPSCVGRHERGHRSAEDSARAV